MIDDILAELEADTSLEVGETFARVTARYFESTRPGDGQVSTPRTAEDLARRRDLTVTRAGRFEVPGSHTREGFSDLERGIRLQLGENVIDHEENLAGQRAHSGAIARAVRSAARNPRALPASRRSA